MKPSSFDILAGLLLRGSGLVIGPEKQYLLETRLTTVMREHSLRDLDSLAERLQGLQPGKAEIERQVVEAMTTNESFFFRDDKPFAHVRAVALPQLHATRPSGSKLRIWSAASSSGQEAYSLAMIVAELRPVMGNRPVEIVGTDLSREQVQRAREGVYTQFEVQRGLPMQNLVKYFRKDGANWRVNDALKAMVSFREWNLLADPRPLGEFDIVFCRNVLIYFDRPTKTRVLDSIARQMPHDGLLYLGGAETVLGITDRFEIVPENRGVYELTRRTVRPALASTSAGR